MKYLLICAALIMPLASNAEDFSGPYVGVYMGHVWGDDKGESHNAATGIITGWAQTTTLKGTQYGLMGGYNWLFGNVLLGVEANYDEREHGGDSAFQEFFGLMNPAFAASTQVESAVSLLGRIGYTLNSKTLIYGTAGYATANVKRTFHDWSVPYQKESHSSWQDGWAAGVGMEYLATETIAVRLEYNYADYGTKKVPSRMWSELYTQELSEESVRVGVSYQF